MGESKINNRGFTDILPAAKAFSITPSDSNDQLASSLPNSQTKRSTAFMVRVGGAGDISGVLAGDTASITFPAVAAGDILPVLFTRINATGTTATGLVGLY